MSCLPTFQNNSQNTTDSPTSYYLTSSGLHQQQSAMSQVPDHRLPFTFIDPSLGLCSVFDTFGIDIESSDVGWNSFLDKPIPQSKLRDLIICSSFSSMGQHGPLGTEFVYAPAAQTCSLPFNALTLARVVTTFSSYSKIPLLPMIQHVSQGK
jgi:hypothetical protein